MEQVQAFLKATAGQNVYYPVKVIGHNRATKAWESFRVEDAQKWQLRALMEQAGFSSIYFE